MAPTGGDTLTKTRAELCCVGCPATAVFTGAVVITLIGLLATGFVARSAPAEGRRRRRASKACAALLDEPAPL
jgi:hypothetical protein